MKFNEAYFKKVITKTENIVREERELEMKANKWWNSLTQLEKDRIKKLSDNSPFALTDEERKFYKSLPII